MRQLPPTRAPCANEAAGPAALKPLIDTGKVEFSYQSTAVESWLKLDNQTWADKALRWPGP